MERSTSAFGKVNMVDVKKTVIHGLCIFVGIFVDGLLMNWDAYASMVQSFVQNSGMFSPIVASFFLALFPTISIFIKKLLTDYRR